MNIWSTIGIASLISVCVSFVFDMIKNRHNLRFERITTEKESRYRSILVFMSVILDESNYDHISTNFKPSNNLDIKKFYIDEVKLHLKFSVLYASKDVIKSISIFLNYPNDENYQRVADDMRKDLWGKRI